MGYGSSEWHILGIELKLKGFSGTQCAVDSRKPIMMS